ncbi:MAG: M15 family metallopeptidase [Treponema sp.]|jgi:hypothetical protein|nr:M15 family metallopeptidase [Treponema sp.]
MNKIDLLKPEARPFFKTFLSALYKHGLKFHILETLRTQAVQDAYYAQGRMSLEDINRLRNVAGLYLIGPAEAKRIITQVRYSKHQDGKAGDIVPVLNGKIPWNITSENAELWLTFGRLGQEAGLHWGGTWEPLNSFGIGWDAPHYQV